MDWTKWLKEQRAASKMVVTPQLLAELGGGWRYADDGSVFAREDGQFFGLEGRLIQSAGREVAGWGQPMLVEFGAPGVVIIVHDKQQDAFLVQARVEPGNPATYLDPVEDGVHAPDSKRHVLVGPPLQASAANLGKAHKGKKPPRAELFEHPNVVLLDHPEDGGRYFMKVNQVGYVAATAEEIGELHKNEIWLSRLDLSLVIYDGEANPFLWACFALENVLRGA